MALSFPTQLSMWTSLWRRLHSTQLASPRVVARLFLKDNGFTLKYEPAHAIATTPALAAGALEEIALAEWFRSRLEKA